MKLTRLVAALGAGVFVIAATSTSTAVSNEPEADPYSRAAKTGEPVEIVDQRTPFDTVYASPEGNTIREISNEPIRVPAQDGWMEVDYTLVERSDGTIGPKAALGGVSIGPGDSKVLATVELAGATLTQRWAAELPEPILEGPRATYHDVYEGVDLVLEMGAAGLSQVLVVPDAAAAANPALLDVSIATEVDGGELSQGRHGATITDELGREIAHTSEPMMWDSSGDVVNGFGLPVPDESARAVEARIGGPTQGDVLTPLPVEFGAGAMKISPPEKLVTGKDVRYPLYIDPRVLGVGPTQWAMIFAQHPNSAFYKWQDSNGQGVGYQNYSGVSTKRLFWAFDTRSVANARVISAQFKARMVWSSTCTPTPVRLRLTGAIGPGTTWNSQPGTAMELTTRSEAAGQAGCFPGGKDVEWNMKAAADYIASHSVSTSTFGLVADERNPTHWKRFLHTASIRIEYTRPPAVPTEFRVDNAACGKLFGRRTTQPILSAKVSDPDGENVRGLFVHRSGNFWIGTHNQQSGPVKSGSRATVTAGLPKDDSGAIASGVYDFRARAEDTSVFKLRSAYGATCRITIDSTLPPPPLIISAGPEWAVNVDTAVKVKAGDISDTKGFKWTLDSDTVPSGGPTMMVADGTATFNVKPGTSGHHILRVWAVDKADNISSAPAELRFEPRGVAPETLSRYDMDEEGITLGDRQNAADLVLDDVSHRQAIGWFRNAALNLLPDRALVLDAHGSATGTSLVKANQSLVVSAWLDPAVGDDAPVDGDQMDAVSMMDGNSVTARLGTDTAVDAFGQPSFTYRFTVRDSVTGDEYHITAPTADSEIPGLVHVVGGYDSLARTLTIKWAGSAEHTVNLPSSFGMSSAGNLETRLGGGGVHPWRGLIDEVNIGAGPLDHEVITKFRQEYEGVLRCAITRPEEC